MLKIAICDDNNNTVRQYDSLIRYIAEKHRINLEIFCFQSGEALLFEYSEEPKQVDIIYLDILMDHINGMEVARKLRECGCEAQIIFLTSCEDYVFEAFDVNAVHYLIKEDTSMTKFEKVFLQVIKRASEKKDEHFIYEFNGNKGIISIRQISYFDIWKRLVTVHYDNGKTAEFYSSMEQLQNRLMDKNFIRTHRSYLVNLSYIKMFQNQSLLLKTGEIIPIGITYAQSLKEAFSEYISRTSELQF